MSRTLTSMQALDLFDHGRAVGVGAFHRLWLPLALVERLMPDDVDLVDNQAEALSLIDSDLLTAGLDHGDAVAQADGLGLEHVYIVDCSEPTPPVCNFDRYLAQVVVVSQDTSGVRAPAVAVLRCPTREVAETVTALMDCTDHGDGWFDTVLTAV